MSEMWEQVREIQDRLDSTITFTLVRFFYDFLASVMDMSGIFYACYILFLMSSAAMSMCYQKDSAGMIIWSMVQNFSMMIFSQNMTLAATGYIDASSRMHLSVSSIRLASGLSILILATVLPETILHKTFTQRSVSLLLYMLTDASSSILISVDFGTNMVYVCILSMAVLKVASVFMNRHTTVYIFKLMNMIVVNIVILALINMDRRHSNTDVRAALLFIVVFLIDTMRSIDGVFEDSRNYAVWKVSQQLFLIYSIIEVDQILLIYISIIFVFVQGMGTRKSTRESNSTLAEIALLMAVNQILTSIQSNLNDGTNKGEFTLLLFYIIIIHTIQQVIF